MPAMMCGWETTEAIYTADGTLILIQTTSLTPAIGIFRAYKYHITLLN
jgi:hypothetical protein